MGIVAESSWCSIPQSAPVLPTGSPKLLQCSLAARITRQQPGIVTPDSCLQHPGPLIIICMAFSCHKKMNGQWHLHQELVTLHALCAKLVRLCMRSATQLDHYAEVYDADKAAAVKNIKNSCSCLKNSFRCLAWFSENGSRFSASRDSSRLISECPSWAHKCRTAFALYRQGG